MIFSASIQVMPLKALLDPQGKAVSASMKNLNLSAIENVRIGKNITLQVTADTETEALNMVTEACKKLLANPIMEEFEISIKAL
ncbi:MAG: phosphoribosylformylglycinamidine synthase subunit PurS [Bacteroidia bacterium]|nr:phosphoribosylformylglycinamidine synthase subunit PurS [Bacteroidia bacterium]HQV00827.1 phosphoribosylformylglycinamidine synthase subunit PurS [Bacteroidia bacterium]